MKDSKKLYAELEELYEKSKKEGKGLKFVELKKEHQDVITNILSKKEKATSVNELLKVEKRGIYGTGS